MKIVAEPPSSLAQNRSGGDLILPEMITFAAVAAESGHPVHIDGETGSGKTHMARLIHQMGPRALRPFVRVNCAAVPEHLFEREMFGHVRGAFTDARENADGFLEAAHGGILFLDEVSELPAPTQPKLLAVLEDGAFRKLGSPREVRVDVQVITATNRDLAEMVRQRQFREDLYYRISVLRFSVPSLRERRRDLRVLVRSLLRKIGRPGTEPPEVSEEAMHLFERYAWPGNIRELENALRTASAFSRGATILPEHLPAEVRGGALSPGAPGDRTAVGSARYAAPADRRDEAEMIRRALEAAGGNKTLAARSLGMSRSTLWAKLQRYGG